MQRQATRLAASLVRQATDLTATGSHAFSSAVVEAVAATAARPVVANGWQTCRSAASAATVSQPWLRSAPHRGLACWARQQSSIAVLAPPAAPCRGPQQQQQVRAASAQAELAEATSSTSSTSSNSSSSGSSASLSVSDSAVERLKELQAKSSEPVMLRVIVEGGGCSGFQYEFAIEEGAAAQQLGETDRLFERDGVRVVCDDISLEFLRGSTVDFESDLMRSAFVIQNNPNAASSCGCGSSFVAK
ncbi:hypothetical protein D9Q98_008389 [Chlorella vulgaris]|uniref:Core domain-containing protein n=1 Tax=Chlorella vulgaris TaxID=3077 RepID=A0A9D4TGK2_CHLVU|nr:hypothetical protein D9Q98_008389 [Chlorella vulgaris]